MDGYNLKLDYAHGNKVVRGVPQTIKTTPAATATTATTEAPTEAQEKGPTKIVIRNVPFEANLQELKELFRYFYYYYYFIIIVIIFISIRTERFCIIIILFLFNRHVGGFKFVRLPVTGTKHRGFAFAEFVSHHEAKRALQAMSDTHLYGRHLVLEFARADRNLDEIREKSKRDFERLSKAENRSGKAQQWYEM